MKDDPQLIPVLIGSMHTVLARLDADAARELRELWRASESKVLASYAEALDVLHGTDPVRPPDLRIIDGGLGSGPDGTTE